MFSSSTYEEIRHFDVFYRIALKMFVHLAAYWSEIQPFTLIGGEQHFDSRWHHAEKGLRDTVFKKGTATCWMKRHVFSVSPQFYLPSKVAI